MTIFYNWVPSISVSTVLAVVGFLLSVPYRKSIESKIANAFDKKLESAKSEYRKDEEVLKDRLKQQSDEIQLLRNGALSNMSIRHTELEKKKLAALEEIWSASIGLTPLKTASSFTKVIKMDVALREAGKNTTASQSSQRFFTGIWDGLKLGDYRHNPAPDAVRIYVPPYVWALFSTYRQVVNYPFAQIVVLKTGIKAGGALKAEPILEALKLALPHQVNFIETYKEVAIPYLIDPLEEKLLATIIGALNSNSSDQVVIRQSAIILKLVQESDSVLSSTLPEIPEMIRNTDLNLPPNSF